MKVLKSASIFLMFYLLVPFVAFTQWSADSLQNLAIADTTGDQAIPKIVATSDGGCYISWFDNRSGNYSIYMQRLNSEGEEQWTPNGLLISDHTQMSWLVDYDLTVDQNDNAVVVFSDIRNGGISELDVFAYKIAPDGSFLWGTDGIGLSDSTVAEFEPAAKVCTTSAGNFVFCWQKSGTNDMLCFQKISATGQKMWGDYGITISGISGQSLSSPDLVPAENDSVIAYWKNSTGPIWAPTTHLYTQKFAPDGSETWTSGGVLIYNSGNISAWTYPQIYTDHNGGAFYTWHDSPSSFETYAWVQHVDAAGNLVFPLNGVQTSTNSNNSLHWNPSLSYLPSTNEIFVFWTLSDGNQNQYGIRGQKFSPQGARLWTDNGLEFIPLASDQISFINSSRADPEIYVSYFTAPGVLNKSVKAFKIDPAGNTIWGSRLLSSSILGTKDDLLMVVNTENRAFCTWSDERNDGGDIYAQNINPDGSLGAFSIPAYPFFDDFEAYAAGVQLVTQNPVDWNTWSGGSGTGEDPYVSNAYAFSGNNSVVIKPNNDLIRLLGSQDSEAYITSFQMYIPNGKTGYFNTMAGFTPNPFSWAMEVYFNVGGSAELTGVPGGPIVFSYAYDTWHLIELIVSLDHDVAELRFNGSILHLWNWTQGGAKPLRLDATDFFGPDTNAEMYIDDYFFDFYLEPDGIEEEMSLFPKSFALEQNYPNPFNPTTTIRYQLPKMSEVKIVIYNLLGQKISTVVDKSVNAGYYEVVWDGLNESGGWVATGNYIYRMETDNFVKSRKMIMMR